MDRGEGTRNYAIVYLYSHQMWAPMTDDAVQTLAGLGDEAYLTASGSGGFDTVHVLVRDDFMLDVRANSPEQARGPAMPALVRLTGAGR